MLAVDVSMRLNIWEADPLEPALNSTPAATEVAKETLHCQNKA